MVRCLLLCSCLLKSEVLSEKVAVAAWELGNLRFELRLSKVNDTLMTQSNLIGNFAKNPTWMLVNTKAEGLGIEIS